MLIARLTTPLARDQGLGMAKRSHVDSLQGRSYPTPIKTIGMPRVLDRKIQPAASLRRGPRGPSGVIVKFSCEARSVSKRRATEPPLKVLPRTTP